ncbi:MAG TPA: hypothetical protein VFL42_09060 [Terriglobales bacterium]|nr:hypothetical protein [Terriglobales bacterium]
MPAYKRFAFLSLSALIVISAVAGCGGSSNPTPQGGFTNASVNGAYAFSISGADAAGFLAVAGSVQSDGAGHITAGTMDINRLGSNGQAQPVTNVAVTGTYSVRADGRGVMTLTSASGNFGLTFVIISAQHLAITVFQGSAVGGGAMDIQTASAFSTAALAGTSAFSVFGADTAGNPLATVGSITTSAAGAITTGVEDFSDAGNIIQNVAITGGTIGAVANNGRTTISVSTASGTSNFAGYVVDANRIKLVQIDPAGTQLTGEASRQTATLNNATLSGPFAFTASGTDITFGPFAAGGVLTSNGAGAITSGTEDINDAFAVAVNVPILSTSTYSIAGPRGTLTLQTGQGPFTFAIYPTTNGVLALELDPGLVVSGTALQQTGSFSNTTISGNYGLTFTAATNVEVDATASLKSDGAGHLTGIVDINNGGTLSTGTTLTGNYSVGGDGRGPFNVSTGLGAQTMAVYCVNGNRALFIEVDGNAVAVGEIQHQ